MKAKVATIVVASILALLAAEVLFRYLPPDFNTMRRMVDIDPTLPMGYQLKQNMRIPFTGMYEKISPAITWESNQSRFRSDQDHPSAPQGHRILTFGDSDIFGWSVNLEDTFQRQMESMDSRLEVLNFGVPGYNVTDILNHMRTVVPEYQANRLLYIANKNDFDLPLRMSAVTGSSALLLQLRFLYQVTIAKPARIEARHSEERRRMFADTLISMAELGEANDMPFAVGFIKWKNWQELQELDDGQHPLMEWVASGRVQIINTQPAFAGQPRIDNHISAPGYASMARLLVDALAIE